MDVKLSSNSLMIIKLEEKAKKPAICSRELKHIPREDEDVRVSIWLMKNRPYFPKGSSGADDSSSTSSDDMDESNFVPVPPPSRSGDSSSHLIDVLRTSSGCSRTEETKQCGIRQPAGAPISAPMKDFDKICYRSETALKRRLNTQEQNTPIAPSKLPRLNIQSQHPMCKGNVSSNVRQSDSVEPSTSFKQCGQGRPHSHSHSNDLEKMIVAKPSSMVNIMQTSNEKTAGVIGRFFKWLFPDA